MARNKAKFAMALAVIAVMAGFAAGSASAGFGGVSIVSDGYSPDFAPNTIQPGNSTTLTLTVNQSGREGARAVIALTGLTAAGLTFVSNADTSASCTTGTAFGGFVACSYSDFAHSYKSDSFAFTSNRHQPYGTYTIRDSVAVIGVGGDSTTSTITYAPKPVVVIPPHDSGMKLCYSVNGQTPNNAGMYATHDAAMGASLMAAGYWAPTAVGFNADGTPVLSCEAPLAGGLLNDPAATTYTDNNGDLLVPGQANIVLGDYPVKLASQ